MAHDGAIGKRRRDELSADDGNAFDGPAGVSEPQGGKKQRIEENIERSSPPKTCRENLLLLLPNELLFAIHVYAKNPALPMCCKELKERFRGTSTSDKVHYLLARWHEAYCYGSLSPSPEREGDRVPSPSKQSKGSKSQAVSRTSSPALPARPSNDLLDNGALPELAWGSRFLPVLPVSEFPFPLCNSFQRSADHYVLDYCLRYPITTVEILRAVEARVLHSIEFGNIAVASGLWSDDEGKMHTHPTQTCSKELDEDSFISASDLEPSPSIGLLPEHLIVTEIPKRLFQFSKSREEASVDTQEGGSMDRIRMDDDLKRLLQKFGDGPLPDHRSVLLLLEIAFSHTPSSSHVPVGVAPFNSFEGLPLAKATFAQSMCMVQLLLALGADPSRKGCLALYIAIRAGWLEGLQMLVERDSVKMAEWQELLEQIRSHLRDVKRTPVATADGTSSRSNNHQEIASSGGLDDPVGSTAASGAPDPHPSSHRKRRRLNDRVKLDHKMLKEAVRHNHWHVSNWIRSKGVAPDLRTIKLLDMKQQPPMQAASSSRTEHQADR